MSFSHRDVDSAVLALAIAQKGLERYFKNMFHFTLLAKVLVFFISSFIYSFCISLNSLPLSTSEDSFYILSLVLTIATVQVNVLNVDDK